MEWTNFCRMAGLLLCIFSKAFTALSSRADCFMKGCRSISFRWDFVNLFQTVAFSPELTTSSWLLREQETILMKLCERLSKFRRGQLVRLVGF
mmetsp:Transcript_739/g.1592  ORF Transcript_739/g.1592 Transcript_739/m.1592 type:complete len:93 (+) Transcript_739:404-682(+)